LGMEYKRVGRRFGFFQKGGEASRYKLQRDGKILITRELQELGV